MEHQAALTTFSVDIKGFVGRAPSAPVPFFLIANPDKIESDTYGQKVTIMGKTDKDVITVASVQIDIDATATVKKSHPLTAIGSRSM